MIEEEIGALVKAHYGNERADILLLSKLGETLGREGKWPIDGDKRTLGQVTSAAPNVVLVADPAIPSFIAVVQRGDEARAHAGIACKKKLLFLRSIPRALLLALTIDTKGEPVHVSLDPRVVYRVGTAPDAGEYIRVDDDLRLTGMSIEDLDELSESDRDRLDTNLREWSARHEIDLSAFGRRPKPVVRKSGMAIAAATSALERLYAAQTPEIAKSITIPMDIALALSRMP